MAWDGGVELGGRPWVILLGDFRVKWFPAFLGSISLGCLQKRRVLHVHCFVFPRVSVEIEVSLEKASSSG